ncbi:MAG TPA: hypothetical protein VGB99_12960 [Acidobacteriota bacterium]
MKRSIWLLVASAAVAVCVLAGSVLAEKRAALTPEQRQAKRIEMSTLARVPYDRPNASGKQAVPRPTRVPAAPPSTTALEYDNGNSVLRSGNTGSFMVGNQFNVGGGGNPIGAWTVTGFTMQNAGPAFLGNVYVTFYGGPGAGTTAPFLTSLLIPGVTGGLQAFALPTALTGTGSFLGGIFNSTSGTCAVTSAPPGTPCDGVALDTQQDSTNPLGFHAAQIQFQGFGNPGINFGTLGNLNAIFRVVGAGLPAELMDFSAESK